MGKPCFTFFIEFIFIVFHDLLETRIKRSKLDRRKYISHHPTLFNQFIRPFDFDDCCTIAQFFQFFAGAQRDIVAFTEEGEQPGPVNDFQEVRYTLDDIKYWYSFAATKENVYSESLYYAPKKQKALVFAREGQTFTFTTEKSRRNLISKVVADNQLFFSVACTMNDEVCAKAMSWFRQMVYFSRDYSDIPRQLLEYSNDSNMLKAISDYAKAADVGIEDMKFEINSKEINEEADLPENIPDEVKAALVQFMHLLSETSNNSETHLKMGQVTATSMHQGEERGGRPCIYSMELSDESDGTRKLMALAPAIESVLSKGGLLLVDEIEKELHPALVDFIVSKFQSKRTNPNGAQIIFTTHSTELLSMELLRKDQLYFVDKDKYDGASELYSISDFSTRTTENIRKGYLLGKYGATPNVEIEEVE